MTQQATTPFKNTSAALVLGMGAPIVQVYDVTAQTANGTITLTWSQPITKGQLRVKSSALNAATTASIGAVTVTDGTNVVVVYGQLLPGTTAGQAFDRLIRFACEIQATSLSFSTTLGGTTVAATINSEFFGNP
jgi:hypothetical protein